ncbi:hypothetical protein MPS_3876 [Mycobacterium pseudoshottsii JCM 15466]|nr:hypothetical protein MMEU_4432 [Mycobacterium marinum str. Europe]GAQ37831.1 hypothetical protein MPS_3876 [Mycobacterium pseudoshottsii JCM 15466]
MRVVECTGVLVLSQLAGSLAAHAELSQARQSQRQQQAPAKRRGAVLLNMALWYTPRI